MSTIMEILNSNRLLFGVNGFFFFYKILVANSYYCGNGNVYNFKWKIKPTLKALIINRYY